MDANYENVMPLTHKRIFGIEMLLQPWFATNLGVYSVNVLESTVVNAFIAAIPAKYRYIRINLNKYNKLTNKDIKTSSDIHYELDLISNYTKIRSKYTPQIVEGLSIAKRGKISIIADLNSNDITLLYRKSKGPVRNLIWQRKMEALKSLVSTSVRFRVGQVYGAYNADNKLCAAAFFVWSHQRVTLILLALTNHAIKNHALEVIIDEFIRTHAEQNLTLRFEYASRERFSSLYSGFGARRFQFMNIRLNRLSKIFSLPQL